MMNWSLRALVAAGLGFVALAVWEQPRIADDMYLAWYLADSGSLWNFFIGNYIGWSGRAFPFVLAGLAVSSEWAAGLFQLLAVPCFLLMSACAYYLATGVRPSLNRGEERYWLLVAAILWLALPVVSETVVQSTVAAAYLWPGAAGLALLCLFRRARDRARLGEGEPGGWVVRAGWFAAGVIVGTGNEQLIPGLFAVLAGWGYFLWRAGQIRFLPAQVWFGVAGLIIGAAILVGAPGNYVRMSHSQNDVARIVSMLARYVMYLGGAYFGLGTGDAGRALWLGIAVIALGGVLTRSSEQRNDAAIWAAASLTTLTPMLPLVNFASPRTTFLPVIFLFMAALAAFPHRRGEDSVHPFANGLIAFSVAMLVAIDGFAGWAANRALSAEMAVRMNMVRVAASEGRSELVVPYLATIPSRLTSTLNPEQDAQFIDKLARRNGIKRGRHDDSAGAPRPQTLNALKALKNAF